MSNGVLIPTPGDGQVAADGVFSGIRAECDNIGLTLDYLLHKLKDELEATTQRAFLARSGEVVYSTPLVAWETRQRARMDAHKLRGDYPSDKLDITAATTDVQDLIRALERSDAITERIAATAEPGTQSD